MLPFDIDSADALHARSAELLGRLADDPTPTLRWYRAATPAIVLGRGQAPAQCAAGALPLMTRFSGGGAVLMDDGLLSLDVLLPQGHPLLDGDLGAVFERVGAAWAAALRILGVPGVALHQGPGTAQRRGSPRDRLRAAVCYATLGRGEVLAGGRKVVGLAQRRRRPGALVQCGLLRRWRPEPLLALLGVAGDAEIVASAVGIDDLLASPPTDETIMTAFHDRLREGSQSPTRPR